VLGRGTVWAQGPAAASPGRVPVCRPGRCRRRRGRAGSTGAGARRDASGRVARVRSAIRRVRRGCGPARAGGPRSASLRRPCPGRRCDAVGRRRASPRVPAAAPIGRRCAAAGPGGRRAGSLGGRSTAGPPGRVATRPARWGRTGRRPSPRRGGPGRSRCGHRRQRVAGRTTTAAGPGADHRRRRAGRRAGPRGHPRRRRSSASRGRGGCRRAPSDRRDCGRSSASVAVVAKRSGSFLHACGGRGRLGPRLHRPAQPRPDRSGKTIRTHARPVHRSGADLRAARCSGTDLDPENRGRCRPGAPVA
jgi:hypothetical protein